MVITKRRSMFYSHIDAHIPILMLPSCLTWANFKLQYTMSFGERLRTARTQKALTQSQLAEAVGIHYTQVGRYEKKGAVPAADVLTRLADALGVSGDYLMNGTADEHAATQLNDRDLLEHFREVERMPPEDRNVVKQLIDAFITKRKLRALA